MKDGGPGAVRRRRSKEEAPKLPGQQLNEQGAVRRRVLQSSFINVMRGLDSWYLVSIVSRASRSCYTQESSLGLTARLLVTCPTVFPAPVLSLLGDRPSCCKFVEMDEYQTDAFSNQKSTHLENVPHAVFLPMPSLYRASALSRHDLWSTMGFGYPAFCALFPSPLP